MTVQASPLAEGSIVPDEHGVATALVFASLNRAISLLATGYASAADIDTAMRLGCGLPHGPFAVLDAVGLGTAHDVLSGLHERTADPAFRPARLLTDIVHNGQFERGFEHVPTTPPAGPVPSRPVERVGVFGTGTMARGIAEVMVTRGLPTLLVSRDGDRAAQAVEQIGASLTRAAAKGRIREADRDRAIGLLECTSQATAVREADLVVEAVVEELPVKRALFAKLGRVCRPGTVLATGTSSLPVTECAAASARPLDVVGLHFFNPAPAMRLVELVHTPVTRPDVLGTARTLCARLGKTPVECADRTGFIVNYLLFAYLNRAIALLDTDDTDDTDSAAVTELDDAVCQAFGYPLGPFALLDLIGLDVSLAILRRLHHTFPEPDFAPAPRLERLVAAGRLGRKSGGGFHPAR